MTSETKNGLSLNHEDLLKIENINNIQEIKEYIRNKFERNTLDHLQNSASIHLNPLFA